MSKIFKNMLPYWKSILVILMLLFVQAWCDLSLPSYTSDIIDVGIQNSGVEHVTPKRITEEEFQTAEFIMTDDEVDLWESLYTKKDGYYERNKASEKELDETDDTLTVALLMNYQMGAMEEDTFKQLMAQQTGQDAKKSFCNMTYFYHVPCYCYGSKEALGRCIGKEFRASLAVTDENLARAVEKKLKERTV